METGFHRHLRERLFVLILNYPLNGVGIGILTLYVSLAIPTYLYYTTLFTSCQVFISKNLIGLGERI